MEVQCSPCLCSSPTVQQEERLAPFPVLFGRSLSDGQVAVASTGGLIVPYPAPSRSATWREKQWQCTPREQARKVGGPTNGECEECWHVPATNRCLGLKALAACHKAKPRLLAEPGPCPSRPLAPSPRLGSRSRSRTFPVLQALPKEDCPSATGASSDQTPILNATTVPSHPQPRTAAPDPPRPETSSRIERRPLSR